MIGNIEAAGNTTRFSEFNAWCDPEALATVLAAEIPTEMIGLDVTRKIVIKGNEVNRLAEQSPWLHDALLGVQRLVRSRGARYGAGCGDPDRDDWARRDAEGRDQGQ